MRQIRQPYCNPYRHKWSHYSRSDQYEKAALWQNGAKNEYLWKGTWNKDSAVTIVGELVNTTGYKWVYTEQQWKYGRSRKVP